MGCCTRCCGCLCKLTARGTGFALLVLVVGLIAGGDPELAFWRFTAIFFNIGLNAQVLYRYAAFSKIRHQCFSEAPWQLWAWEHCEEILSKRPSAPVDAVPTIDLPARLREPGTSWADKERYVCKEMAEHFGGWGVRPFVIKGLLDGSDLLKNKEAWSLDWIAAQAPNETMHSIDLGFYRKQWHEIRKCPWKRFEARTKSTVQDIVQRMKKTNEMYVSFAETFFGDTDVSRPDLKDELPKEKRRKADYIRQMAGVDQIWSLCAGDDKAGKSFSGFSGEIFFGHGDKRERQPAGSPVHAAFMRNLFLQMVGKRRWRMWSPAYSQFMRVQGFIGYLSGTGAHSNWNAGDPEAIGLNDTYAPHIHAIPSISVDMEPGDLLYVPPWWWHDTRVHSGYSLGISARGQDWPGSSFWDLPVVRFLTQWNGLDAMVFDTFHVLPIVYGDPRSGRRSGFVELRQHAAR